MENIEKFKVKFKGWNPRFFASYEEAMGFIEKANVVLDDFWLVKVYDDGKLIKKMNSFDFNNIKLKAEFPKTFTFTSFRGSDVKIILEKDTNSIYDIIISVAVNNKQIANNIKANISSFMGTEAPNGVFLVFINPNNNRKTAIRLNDCPKLLKYLFYIGKNRNLLEDYI
ncbi:hypothetical protein [uncultured Megamonas sp.]|uniref:hypothetical protein n=1 Tax=uncultured Megamonas sp. TaxID=286140 RepID=UPI00259B8263|nr:hypothetical protein [uncultured Megamonas sp.]